MFSIIIPTYNRIDLLIKCLNCISVAMTFDNANQYEIIVTDDSTDDITRQYIQQNYSWVKWVKGPQKGPAANRNNGAKYANNKWLIFTDDDCLPTQQWLQTYSQAIINNPLIKAFEGAIHAVNPQELKEDLTECPVNTNGGCFWSANIAVRKNIFETIGGFDERYKIAAQEDQQIKIDIEKITAIKFLSDCIVMHPVKHFTFQNQYKSIPKKSKNFALFVAKNKPDLSLTKFALAQYKFHLSGILRHSKKKKFKSTVISLCWVLWGVPMNIINLAKARNEAAIS